ncbi:hypothetical protein EV175_004715, partial [Coemansia sp. RSA 1933]
MTDLKPYTKSPGTHAELRDISASELDHILGQNDTKGSNPVRVKYICEVLSVWVLANSSKAFLIAALLGIFVSSYLMALQAGPLPFIIEHLAVI